VLGPCDYRYRGADVGILVTPGRRQNDDNELTEPCRAWIDGIRSQFEGTPIDGEAEPPKRDALALKFALEQA
jgi:hypothetical protein